MNILGRVNGVNSIIDVTFINKFDTANNYSGNVYDLTAASRQGVIYPPLDPSIFEVKFPNKDIKGRVVNF